MQTTTSRSDVPRVSGLPPCRGLILASFLLALPAAAGIVESIEPAAPADGAVVGARPVFEMAYEGLGALDPRQLRLRITLTPLRPERGERTRPYVFDGRRSSRGWHPGAEGRVVYRPRKPLPDGSYRWSVQVWDGVAWSPRGKAVGLRVDTVPPADVDGLRLEGARDGVLLTWDPVTEDAAGRPEYVARYVVYRYERRPFPRPARAQEVGVTEAPRFVDRSPGFGADNVLYYRVVAEDLAGNQALRRD